MSHRLRLITLLALGATALVATGCIGDPGTRDAKVTDDTSTTAGSTSAASGTAQSTAAAGGETVTVELGKGSEFAVDPSVASVPAGPITFDVTNDGTMPHELVVLQTDKTIKELTKPDGTADETNNIGESGDVEAGASKSFTVDLEPGHYWLICNLPGHFAGGMYTEFTVTA